MKKKVLLIISGLFLVSQAAFAQNAMHGRIVDDKGEGMSDVTVKVKGKNQGAVTDNNGNFVIKADEGETLIVSSIGYTKAEVAAAEGMKVKMAASSKGLGEVVITAMGIKTEKKALGYAQTTVKSDAINEGQNGNALNALSGKVAGLQITSSSGTPGASSFIQLRGISSISISTQPLIVVDGMPIDISQSAVGDPSEGTNALIQNVSGGSRAFDINPEDIEDVSVLKGSAASALYGSEGSNGVILITTKKGSKKGKGNVGVEVNSSLTWDKVNKLPALQDMYTQGSKGIYKDPSTTNKNSWGALADTMYWNGATTNPWDTHGNLVGKSDPTAKTKFSPYDNASRFFQTGTTKNNNVALSAGTDKATMRFSIGNLNQTGIIPNSNIDRTNIGLNAEIKPIDKLIIGTAVNYVNTHGTYVQQGSNLAGVMLGLMRTPISFDNSNGLSGSTNQNMYLFADGSERSYRGHGIYDNPYYTINENQFKDNTNRFYGNAYATWNPITWLSITDRVGTDMYNTTSQQNFGTQTSQISTVGSIRIHQDNNRDVTNNLMATFKPNVGKDFDLSFLLGQYTKSNNYLASYMRGDNLVVDRWYSINNTTNQTTQELTNSTYREMAEFTSAKLAYKNMLFVEGTARMENSTSYWPNYKTNIYTGINGSFVFTELTKEKTPWLDFGKLRMSYGTVGKNPPSQSTQTRWLSSSVQDGWVTGNVSPINGQPAFASSNAYNPNLKPELTSTFDIGTELSFLKNRISLDYTYYNQLSKNLFVKVPIAPSGGNTIYFTNAGTILNQGHEVQLNLVPIRKKDFRWDVTLNYSRNRSLVKELADGVERIDLNGFTGSTTSLLKGQPFGIFYGNAYVRDAAGHLVLNDDKTSASYGMPIVATEQKNLGSVMPKWLGGLRNTFTYKGISLGVLFETRQGGVLWNGTRGALTGLGRAAATAGRATDSTVFSGVLGHVGTDGKIYHTDATGADVLGAGSTNNVNVKLNQNYYSTVGSGYTVAEPFVEDASWIRLRELSIGYALPSKLLGNKKYFKGVSFGIVGRNLWLKTKYQGVDPETSLAGGSNAQGLDYFNNPGTKTLGIKLKLNF